MPHHYRKTFTTKTKDMNKTGYFDQPINKPRFKGKLPGMENRGISLVGNVKFGPMLFKPDEKKLPGFELKKQNQNTVLRNRGIARADTIKKGMLAGGLMMGGLGTTMGGPVVGLASSVVGAGTGALVASGLRASHEFEQDMISYIQTKAVKEHHKKVGKHLDKEFAKKQKKTQLKAKLKKKRKINVPRANLGKTIAGLGIVKTLISGGKNLNPATAGLYTFFRSKSLNVGEDKQVQKMKKLFKPKYKVRKK
jgi:hypothetical protein